MDKNISFNKAPAQDQGDSPEYYSSHARPLTSKLLASMELGKHYKYGKGDYLYYEEGDQYKKVLDLTGGYGANLLGHKNPALMQKIQEWCISGSPSLTQGSFRLESGNLAKLISDLLSSETSEGPWVSTFSNSGTEAIEAAIKHSLIYYRNKLQLLQQEISKELNLSLIEFNKLSDENKPSEIYKFRRILIDLIPSLKMTESRRDYFFHQLANVHSIDELISLLRDINQIQIDQVPVFLSLENAYHGKTLGSLSLTASEAFRNPFYLNSENNPKTHFISSYIDQISLERFLSSLKQDIVLMSHSRNGIIIHTHSFSTIAASFIEPIQGEAGVKIVPESFMAQMKKYSLQNNFLLVFDEIQSGMYRTGLLAAGNHSHITADIYTFSKSLGGGVAKIAATTILSRKYVEEFGYLHTSTFSDDDFSATIAIEVLSTLMPSTNTVREGMKSADYLQARLEWLKSQYPEIIKEIRGIGLMLAIEFEDSFQKMGFEFKTICDAKMQGYLMASVLLNHEALRMNPSLSNNLTLRIQPSIYFDIIQTEELITGLSHLCQAFVEKDITYFLSAVYPGQEIQNKMTPELSTNIELGKRPISVFLCHLIDEAHIKKTAPSLKNVASKNLLHKLALGKDLAEFEIYHAQTLKDESGKEMDIIMLGISITSEELKKSFNSRNRQKVVQKVQNAIDYSKSIGATTVGLGQFTSIVSGNGLYLDSRGMNLTTGNAYTISLTVQSALKSAQEKNINLNTATVALIGAAGNIMSVASSLMADHIGKLILIHHSPIDSSLKFQEALKRILNDIQSSQVSNLLVTRIKSYWKEGVNLIDFLNNPEISEVLTVTNDLAPLQEADIILSGASSSNGFIEFNHLKQNAIIVDVAVPSSIGPELLEKLEKHRPDITYHLGGVAKLPQEQSIDFFVLPLEKNECYACMAETFAIGFSGKRNFINIGDLSKDIVVEVQNMATQLGFQLARCKNRNSL